MNTQDLIQRFKTHHTFSDDEILAIRTDETLRADLVQYFRTHHDRPFALALLNRLIELRKDTSNEISMYDLMLASFLLGTHGQVEDCLKVWEAKRVDFDTYCGVDIQLVPFAGVDQTIAFLQTQTDNEEAKKALKYVLECAKCGDFDDLEAYNNEITLWL
jgi:hypothetical protein